MAANLDLTSLDDAIAQLSEGLARAQASPNDSLIRDGAIQRFEYTYELCHKMLKRFLEMTEPNPELLDAVSFQNLIRLGSERGLLLTGWDHWRNFRAARGTSSHTNDRKKAEDVFAQIPAFLDEAQHLRRKLKERLSTS
jgi:nucleotidyltransferase substrate binding protein (TIGR01987 family)